MRYCCSQANAIRPAPPAQPVQSYSNKTPRIDKPLLIETAVVTVAAIAVVRFVNVSFLSAVGWLLIPGILAAAALVPPAVRARGFAQFAFDLKSSRYALRVAYRTSLVVFVPLFLLCWLIRYYGFTLPLQFVLPARQQWLGWLFYQFMYVAVAEEVFFRGYVQGNILSLTSSVARSSKKTQQWISIVLSAAVFALVHLALGGQIISVLTFLPGLVLGWLFVKTGSLLAPILFHALANCFYLFLAAAPA